MQDGASRGEEAGAWLRENLKNKPEPKVTLTWEPGPALTPTQQARLLQILFEGDVSA